MKRIFSVSLILLGLGLTQSASAHNYNRRTFESDCTVAGNVQSLHFPMKALPNRLSIHFEQDRIEIAETKKNAYKSDVRAKYTPVINPLPIFKSEFKYHEGKKRWGFNLNIDTIPVAQLQELLKALGADNVPDLKTSNHGKGLNPGKLKMRVGVYYGRDAKSDSETYQIHFDPTENDGLSFHLTFACAVPTAKAFVPPPGLQLNP